MTQCMSPRSNRNPIHASLTPTLQPEEASHHRDAFRSVQASCCSVLPHCETRGDKCGEVGQLTRHLPLSVLSIHPTLPSSPSALTIFIRCVAASIDACSHCFSTHGSHFTLREIHSDINRVCYGKALSGIGSCSADIGRLEVLGGSKHIVHATTAMDANQGLLLVKAVQSPPRSFSWVPLPPPACVSDCMK